MGKTVPLELDSLRNSIRALTDLLAVSENEARMGQLSEVERNGIRSGVIQHFEVAYELSWKNDGTLAEHAMSAMGLGMACRGVNCSV